MGCVRCPTSRKTEASHFVRTSHTLGVVHAPGGTSAASTKESAERVLATEELREHPHRVTLNSKIYGRQNTKNRA